MPAHSHEAASTINDPKRACQDRRWQRVDPAREVRGRGPVHDQSIPMSIGVYQGVNRTRYEWGLVRSGTIAARIAGIIRRVYYTRLLHQHPGGSSPPGDLLARSSTVMRQHLRFHPRSGIFSRTNSRRIPGIASIMAKIRGCFGFLCRMRDSNPHTLAGTSS